MTTITDTVGWTAERAAIMLGTSLADLLALCPDAATAEQLRRVLADRAVVDATMRQVVLNTRDAGSPDAPRLLTEARIQSLVERAASTAAMQERTAKSRAHHEATWRCAVTGQYDPSVKARRLLSGRTMKLSDRGEAAVRAAMAETLTDDELAAARDLLGLEKRPRRKA